jgi:malonyl-CoA O-methyltransferase
MLKTKANMPFEAHALKARVARQFSRAASAYDSAAQVQLEIAEDALQLCESGGRNLLDIGCGTGRISRRLLASCPEIIALDLAEGMLSYAREQITPNQQGNIHWLAGDAESLPLCDAAVERVFSSMALQWCASQKRVMDEIYRVLRPGGSATLAIMAKGSMTELSHCWQRLDHHAHVNQFTSTSDMKQAATQAGFTVVVREKSYLTWHSNVRELLGSIKAIGANVVTETGNHSVINRAMLKRLQLCYQNEFASSRSEDAKRPLPLSYHVCFLQLSKEAGGC